MLQRSSGAIVGILLSHRYNNLQCGRGAIRISRLRGDPSSVSNGKLDEDAVVKRHPSKEEDERGFPEEHRYSTVVRDVHQRFLLVSTRR